MDIQVVHHQMDGLGFRILNGHLEGYLRELKRRTVRCGECEMAAGFGLYGAEDISRAAALVFVISSRFPPRYGWTGRADVGVQRDGLIIQSDNRLFGIVW